MTKTPLLISALALLGLAAAQDRSIEAHAWELTAERAPGHFALDGHTPPARTGGDAHVFDALLMVHERLEVAAERLPRQALTVSA